MNSIGQFVVAQLAERSLPISEIRGSNPVEKTKIKKKRPRMDDLKYMNSFTQDACVLRANADLGGLGLGHFLKQGPHE